MKKVLIINGHQYYEQIAEGKLTQTFIDRADSFFKKHGFEIKHSAVENAYDVNEEVEKFVWADYILFQYPVYWMGVPWITKKYIDEVFSAGQNKGLYVNDGRSRSDASKTYGSGGSMQGTKYMLSLTYNCPASEFDNEKGFFDGMSLDQAHVAMHKTFAFCAAEPLQTYAIHDIFKGDLDLNSELEKFDKILESNFLN